MPKVLIVTPSAYLRGGVETIIHDLCAELPRFGWSAELGLAAEETDCLVNFSPTEGVTIAPREGRIHGVVPVQSHFPGLVTVGLVTEGVFRDGHNALTFEVGNMDASRHVIALDREPGLLESLSAVAIVSQKGPYRAWADAFDACLRADQVRAHLAR